MPVIIETDEPFNSDFQHFVSRIEYGKETVRHSVYRTVFGLDEQSTTLTLAVVIKNLASQQLRGYRNRTRGSPDSNTITD